MTTSVQADRTGDRPMTQAEFDRTDTGATRELSGRFEESAQVLSAMLGNDLYWRADDYYATIAARYRALTLPRVRAALPRMLDPARTIWVVVGDMAKVAPQLTPIGLPIETIRADRVR